MATYKGGGGWNRDQLRKLSMLVKDNFINRISADTVHAEQVTRIFEGGQKTNNQKIGKYSNPQYVELRKKKGRETSFINLRFTGALQLDYSNGYKTTRESGNVQVVKLKSQRNVDIVSQQEKRFGKIFDLTANEIDLFYKTTLKELQIYFG